MNHFDAVLQKQLNFNFAATWATQKKNGEDVQSSCLWDIDLNSVPKFSRDTTDRHELYRYVLEDILTCTIDTPFIVCIREDGDRDKVARGQQYYSSFAKAVCQDHNRKKLQTKSWRISGKRYIVLVERLCWSSHYEAITSHSLSRSAFIKSFNKRTGDFGLLFVNADSVLNVPWRDAIYFTDTIMFFGRQFDQFRTRAPEFWKKSDPEYAHHVFRQFASEYLGDSHACAYLFAAYKDCM